MPPLADEPPSARRNEKMLRVPAKGQNKRATGCISLLPMALRKPVPRCQLASSWSADTHGEGNGHSTARNYRSEGRAQPPHDGHTDARATAHVAAQVAEARSH